MNLEVININEVVFPERNVRIHTKEQVQELIRSIEMFGQTRPIIIDERNVVLCGNGLTIAMKEMGATTINALRKTGLSDKQKKKLMIADNKTFALGLDDTATLMEFINELSDDLDIPGFDSEILETMVADAEEITEELTGYGILSDEQIQGMNNSAVRKEERINNMQGQPQPTMPTEAQQGNYSPQPTVTPIASQNNAYQPDMEVIDPVINQPPTGELKKYVVCPKCGEMIWL